MSIDDRNVFYENEPNDRPRPQPTPMGRGRSRRRSNWLGTFVAILLLVILTCGVVYVTFFADVHVQRTGNGLLLYFGTRQAQPAETHTVSQSETPAQAETPEADTSSALAAQPAENPPSVEIESSPAAPATPASEDEADGTLSLQEIYKKCIGSDEASDLAVLKVDATDLQLAEFGDSGKLAVGDRVVAIGDPLGAQLRGTMTSGIVSAINRDLEVNDRTMTLIQTDAALNNGNSGGPLINCYGQVIGINTMKLRSYYSTTAEGLGFAIPMAVAKPILEELMENGYVAGRPAIGISYDTLPLAFRIYYNLPEGVYINAVYDGSDAQAKGVAAGDIITAVNGTRVTSIDELNRVKNQFTAGDSITLTLYNGGSYRDVEVTLIDQATGQ